MTKVVVFLFSLMLFGIAVDAATTDPAAKADPSTKTSTATTSEADFGDGCGPVKQTEAEKQDDVRLNEIADKAKQHRTSEGTR